MENNEKEMEIITTEEDIYESDPENNENKKYDEAEQETGSEIPDSDTGENDTEDNDTEENDIQENNEQYNDTGAVSDEKQLTGSVEVIKKAEFVLLTDDGTYYEFLFKKKPSGLMEIEAGTRVTVTYNGDISEDNIISGGIISIETQ